MVHSALTERNIRHHRAMGRYIVSSVRTLAELEGLGKDVLARNGVTEIDPERLYPADLRRQIYDAIFERFGANALFWVGLETPEYWFSGTFEESPAYKTTAMTRSALEQGLQVCSVGANVDLINMLLRHADALVDSLNDAVASTVLAAPFSLGWSIKRREVRSRSVSIMLVSRSSIRIEHEAFVRAIFHWCLRITLPRLVGFTLTHNAAASQPFDGYVENAFLLELSIESEPLDHQDLLSVESRKARDDLLKAALARVMKQEAITARALSELELAHQQTIESMRYASVLQRAQLPSQADCRQYFADFAVSWEPRDLIGGDIWWFSRTGDSRRARLAMIDCTGHGVPGAMLAMLVIGALGRVNQSNATNLSLSETLEIVQLAIQTAFPQLAEASAGNDVGVDLVLFEFDPDRKLVSWAGAGMGFVHFSVESNCFERIQVARFGLSGNAKSRQHIGCGQKSWVKGDRYFLYTDGLTDQIGRIGHGPARAFGNGRLMERLRQSVNNAAEEVNRSLGMALQQWQGPEKRRDDLSFLIVVL